MINACTSFDIQIVNLHKEIRCKGMRKGKPCGHLLFRSRMPNSNASNIEVEIMCNQNDCKTINTIILQGV